MSVPAARPQGPGPWLAVMAVAGLLMAACAAEDGAAPTATPLSATATAPRAAATAPRATATSPRPTGTAPTGPPTASPAAATASSTAQPVPPETPAGRPAPEIEVPDGFAVRLVGEGFNRPTTVSLDAEGRVWVTEEGGRVFILADHDGDGFFERRSVFADGFIVLSGLAFGPDAVYLSHRGHVARASDDDGDGVADRVRDIVSNLPNGRHQNNGVAFGPDGRLYITNGSTCNDCDEEDQRSATILRVNPDGSDLRVFARGLRNPYDLVFTPDGRLWAGDNGSDPPCNTIDELNLIVEGGDYGWPYGPGCDSFASGRPPVADLGFNTASTGLAYYGATAFPPEYGGNFFITLWGSLEFAPTPGGRVLVRVIIADGEDPTGEVEQFATGFERPIDVLVDRDGSLLVLDYDTGRLYRIVHEG